MVNNIQVVVFPRETFRGNAFQKREVIENIDARQAILNRKCSCFGYEKKCHFCGAHCSHCHTCCGTGEKCSTETVGEKQGELCGCGGKFPFGLMD